MGNWVRPCPTGLSLDAGESKHPHCCIASSVPAESPPELSHSMYKDTSRCASFFS